MATPTYDLLDSVTLASSASDITFSSIPQTYGDLVLVVNTVQVYLRLNGVTSNSYPLVYMAGNGSSTFSGTQNGTAFLSSYTSTAGGMCVYQIMDYSATDKQKTVLGKYSQASQAVEQLVGRFISTSAVTSVVMPFVTYPAGTTFYLYGIAKAL